MRPHRDQKIECRQQRREIHLGTPVVIVFVANNLGFLSGKYKHVGFIVFLDA